MCVEEVSSQSRQLIRPQRKRKLGGRRDRGKAAPTYAQGLRTCSPCRDTHRAVGHPETQAGWNVNRLGGGGGCVTAEQGASAFLKGPELRCPRSVHQNPMSLPASLPSESKQVSVQEAELQCSAPRPSMLGDSEKNQCDLARKVNIIFDPNLKGCLSKARDPVGYRRCRKNKPPQ